MNNINGAIHHGSLMVAVLCLVTTCSFWWVYFGPGQRINIVFLLKYTFVEIILEMNKYFQAVETRE